MMESDRTQVDDPGYEPPVVTDLGRIEDITQMPKGNTTIFDGQGNAKSQ
jgi:hypothetical protein